MWTGSAIVMLVVGAAIGLFTGVQFKNGATFGYPVAKFERKIDPFGFWLEILIQSAFGIFFAAIGLIALVLRVQ